MNRRRSGFDHGPRIQWPWIVEFLGLVVLIGLVLGAADLVASLAKLLEPSVP